MFHWPGFLASMENEQFDAAIQPHVHHYPSNNMRPEDANPDSHGWPAAYNVALRNSCMGLSETEYYPKDIGNVKHIGIDGFQLSLDVHHFAPNEVTVKTIGHDVVIEGHHEEKEDSHGHILRSFVRRYSLPEEYDSRDVQSTFSSDGVLTVRAPHAAKIYGMNKRNIPILRTGPVRLSK